MVQNIPVNVTYELSTDLENAIKLNYPTVGDENETDFYEHLLAKSNNPVILYLHGNANARGATHRVELYKILRSLGCHIITFDYRFYGDSTKIEPTEAGVVADAMAMYKYVTSQTDRPIFIWGHSLGTGVATHLMSLLQEINGPRPRGVFLESPFNNIKDEVREHPFAVLFKHLPWFEYTITDPMNANKFVFASDQHIAEFKAPVAIMHAEDDVVVPFQLGYKVSYLKFDSILISIIKHVFIVNCCDYSYTELVWIIAADLGDRSNSTDLKRASAINLFVVHQSYLASLKIL